MATKAKKVVAAKDRKAEIAANNSKRLAEVGDWLRKHNARFLWAAATEKGCGQTATVESYSIGPKVIFIRWFVDKDGALMGWDILRPVCEYNDTEKTLAAADEYVTGTKALDQCQGCKRLGKFLENLCDGCRDRADDLKDKAKELR